MIASFRSELVKLLRRNTILGYVGAATAFTVLITVVSIINADDPNADGPGPSDALGLEELAEPGGYLAGFEVASTMLGIIALALFAVAVPSEFTTGTIRERY